MRFVLAVLYTALLIGANAAHAGIPEAEAARDGTMSKLVFSEPKPVSDVAFTDADGREHRLTDFAGKVVVVNFWATWCAPCRKEMPTLSALQRDLGGENFQVVTIATGRNDVTGIRKFFAEVGVDNLPVYTDPRQKLARQMGVLGLPVSLILDTRGHEIARLIGEADWSGESARAVIGALTD